jgi:hypothetical protein
MPKGTAQPAQMFVAATNTTAVRITRTAATSCLPPTPLVVPRGTHGDTYENPTFVAETGCVPRGAQSFLFCLRSQLAVTGGSAFPFADCGAYENSTLAKFSEN